MLTDTNDEWSGAQRFQGNGVIYAGVIHRDSRSPWQWQLKFGHQQDSSSPTVAWQALHSTLLLAVLGCDLLGRCQDL